MSMMNHHIKQQGGCRSVLMKRGSGADGEEMRQPLLYKQREKDYLINNYSMAGFILCCRRLYLL